MNGDDEGCEVLRMKKLFDMKGQLWDVERSSEGGLDSAAAVVVADGGVEETNAEKRRERMT